MAADIPLIDSRTYDDLVAQVEELAESFTDGVLTPPAGATSPSAAALAGVILDQTIPNPQGGAPLGVPGRLVDDALAQRLAALPNLGPVKVRGWRRGQGDFGAALIRVFGRMAELALNRLNRLPDRNFLAFLDLIGVRPEPPQPARVPITFELAAGSPDALVPAGTQVAATPLSGEKDPVLFETERDLVVTRTQLAAVFTREPGRDRYVEDTAVAKGEVPGDFTPFAVAVDSADPDRNRIGHRFYVGNALLGNPEVKDLVVLHLTPDDATRPWPRAVTWEAWNGAAWVVPSYDPKSDVAPDPNNPDSWTVTLHNLAPVPPLAVGGVTSSWLRGSLTTPLPSGELTDDELLRSGPPTAAFAADPSTKTYEPLNIGGTGTFQPFGDRWLLPVFYLAVEQPLDKPASQVEIEIDVASSGSGSPPILLSPSAAALSVLPAETLTLRPAATLLRTATLAPKPAPSLSTFSTFSTAAAGTSSPAMMVQGQPAGLSIFSPFPQQEPMVPVFTWEYLGDSGWTAIPDQQITFVPARGSAGGAGPFLSSGTVRFEQPLDWIAGTVAGLPDTVARFWLRVRVTLVPGGVNVRYQAPTAAPVVTRVRCSVSWVLPRLDKVSLSAQWSRSDLPAQLGFANQVPVDLTKDFFPFGEKPRIGDAFYLASDEALAKPGAQVRIDLQVTNPNPQQPGPPLSALPSPDLTLAWEYWNGRKWALLGLSGKAAAGQPNPFGLSDGTGTLATNGEVSFVCPGDLAPAEVGGKTARFLRVRINSGNYGLEAAYVPTAGSTQLAALAPTAPLLVAPEAAAPLRTAAATTGGTGVTATATTTPVIPFQLVPASFRPPSIHGLTLGYTYLTPARTPEHLMTENDFVFTDEIDPTGALKGPFTPFTPPTDGRPTLYLGFDRPGDATGFANRPTTLYLGVSPTLYDPAAAPQPVAEEATVVWQYWNGSAWQRLGTRDETRGLTRRGLVTFLGPDDFRASTEFGRQAFWLRARLERGEFPLQPRLARILLNTMWAVEARTIAGEVLGSGRGEAGQTFTASQTPVLAGQQLEVVEPEIPSADELAELAAEEGEDAVTVVRDAAGQVAEVRVRWHEVPDFYGSGPRSRHYTLDSTTGFVTFGDGQRGLPPPPGRGNVRLALYRAGGGLAGNRPAGNIAKLKGTVPYIKSVVQTEAASGGAATESLDDLRGRGPRTLRHRDRSVAPADFEDLALAASTEVARARCLPAHDGTDAGQVGLVIVRRSTLAKPVPDIELLGEVEDYLAARLSPVVDLRVVGPDWVRITVSAEIVPLVLEAATDVENAVRDRLTAFLHPLTGGDGTGWSFGRRPHRSDLFALIESTPGVDHVDWLDVLEEPDEPNPRPERSLLYAGAPQIRVAGNAGDMDGGAA